MKAALIEECQEDSAKILHVTPKDDSEPHQPSYLCWCSPSKKTSPIMALTGAEIWVHNLRKDTLQ